MSIAERTDFDATELGATKREVKNHDTTILLGYSIFAIVLLIAIYFDSMSSGTPAGDFVSMTVFP
jgi:hypothetical protein